MRITTHQLGEMKRRGERFSMLTAYEYSIARLLDDADVPVLLVGDSLGVVVLGHETTLNVTMDDMVRHTQSVVRGSKRALVVADMPFLSFQVSADEAVRNAGRLIQEGGAQAVKLEGGVRSARTIERIAAAGIPVMGHIGLTPQSIHQMGGYRIQGKTTDLASHLLDDADAVEQAGAFAVVLEGMPTPLAGRVSKRLHIPTIGIGAGPECDAQVQVIHDLLGLFTDFVPRHARRYANLAEQITTAVRQYDADVRQGAFPSDRESTSLDQQVLAELDQRLGAQPAFA